MSTDHKAELLTTLTVGIAALTASQQWKDWLTAQSRFHNHSFNNVLLICLQDPEATRVAGFRTWKNLGRSVRKGEKAIWIMAPMTRKVAGDDQAPPEEPRIDETRTTRVLSGVKAVPIFDVRQTDGEPLIEVTTRLTGDAPGIYTHLTEVAHSIGYTVDEENLDGGRNGDCTFDLKRIRLEARNDEAQQVKTLAHELAHAMLHEHATDRALCELEAESVAFIVCASLGIDSDSYSFGYVAKWAGGGDEAVTAIRASGVAIQATANEILGGMQQDAAGKRAA